MHAVTLSSKFQVVIPKALREAMHYQPGEKFLLIPKGNILQIVPQLSLEQVSGVLKGSNTQHIRDRQNRV